MNETGIDWSTNEWEDLAGIESMNLNYAETL